MKTRNKVLIGVAVIGIAYFLWDRSKKKKAELLGKSSDGKIITNPLPAVVPTKPNLTEVALNNSGVAPIVKDSYAENQRQAELAQAEYAKQLAENERQRLAEQQSATMFAIAEQKRLADERAQIDERERIANQERLFLLEEEIRNRKNQAIRDTSGMYNQRFLDGVDNNYNRGVELFAV
jgi:hypothetical protein